jgi:hypothetical protein
MTGHRPPRELDAFVRLIGASKLLDEPTLQSALERFHRVRPGRPANEDLVRAFAAHLVVHGYLTAWQSERLLNGQSQGFFLDQYKLYDHLGYKGTDILYRAEDLSCGEHVILRIRPATDRKRAEYTVED